MNPRQKQLIDYLFNEIEELEARAERLAQLADDVEDLEWDDEIEALAMSQLPDVYGKAN